jgi:flagellar biosynthesis protein FlhF
MLVRKFYAASARHALRLVREALGGEALILSNRRTAHGIEIMAVAQKDVEAVTRAAVPADAVPPPPVPGDGPASASEPLAQQYAVRHYPTQQIATQQVSAHQDAAPYEVVRYGPGSGGAAPYAGRPYAAGPSDAASYDAGPSDSGSYDSGPFTRAPYDLVHEVRLLRSLVEGQLSALAWGDLKRRDPAKGEVMRRLLGAGFSAGLSREMIGELSEGLDLTRAMRLTKTRLQQRLRTAAPDAGLVDAGGIIALVGPTGVGKTTTVAKLAAECVVQHGAARLALVTTDTYRIGAVDQLRIYGKILGVPVFAIRNESDLRATLEDLHSRHLVLIDTVGMSQRDRRLADQVALLSGSTRSVRRVLLLSAVSQANVLEDVVRAYRGDDLAGCILTKVDEALTLGAALDALARHGLTLHYVANGQRVPEDLHKPNALYLIERAFRDGSQAGGVEDGDMPLTLAAGQN